MKLSLLTFIAASLFVGSSYANTSDEFDIYYYRQPNFEEQAGSQHGTISRGESAGRPRANMSHIQSIQAPEWLQVTIFSGYAYSGQAFTTLGNAELIDPPFTVHSIKYKNTNQAD
ncbi:unnamed protein product [Cunninghamella echinulata]